MSRWIANSVFPANGTEYAPGSSVPDDLPDAAALLEKGFIVPGDGKRTAQAEEEPSDGEDTPDEPDTQDEDALGKPSAQARKPLRSGKTGDKK